MLLFKINYLFFSEYVHIDGGHSLISVFLTPALYCVKHDTLDAGQAPARINCGMLHMSVSSLGSVVVTV